MESVLKSFIFPDDLKLSFIFNLPTSSKSIHSSISELYI